MSEKLCETEGCISPPLKGLRFCYRCKHIRLQEMKQNGYLSNTPLNRSRHPTQKENTQETKFGPIA